MMRTSDIVSWLSEVEKRIPRSKENRHQPPPSTSRLPRKPVSCNAPTPPPDDDIMPPPKRQKVQHVKRGDNDEDEQALATAEDICQRSDPNAPVSSPSAHSSQRSSPRPRHRSTTTNMSKPNIEMRSMSSPAEQPPGLAAMRARLLDNSRGKNIFSSKSKNMLLQSYDEYPEVEALIADPGFFFSDQRDDLGTTPVPDDVLKILDAAAECTELGLGKPGWNNEVHHPLLCMALRNYDWGNPFKTLTKVVPCASAALIDEYKPPTGPDKPIDYCLCIDPKYVGHGVPPPGIETLRSHLPLSSINVISEAGLFGRPIAVPIKTKSPREGLDNAVSQLSMWLAAHLGLLDQLVDYGNLALDEEPNDSGLTLEDIGFFPGLIVQGHDWHFVAANREGPKTVIWSKVFLGSTSDIVGIYQIVAALQILRDWTEKVYWPWLQRVVWQAVRYFRRD